MKILVMSSRIPFPLEKGDKLRLFHQLKHLSEEHEVILCCLSSQDATPEQRQPIMDYEMHVFRLSWVRRLWRGCMSDSPSKWFGFGASRSTSDSRPRGQAHARRHLWTVGALCRIRQGQRGPKALDYMDALSAGMHRRANNETRLDDPTNGCCEPKHASARYESRVFDYFDGACIISRNDRLLIPHGDRDRIELVPR